MTFYTGTSPCFIRGFECATETYCCALQGVLYYKNYALNISAVAFFEMNSSFYLYGYVDTSCSIYYSPLPYGNGCGSVFIYDQKKNVQYTSVEFP